MKLGSIVGIVLSGILIVAGIIMCIIGMVSANNNDLDLFMQVDENGTHYIQSVSSETTKISLGFENANVIIKGGAEKSQIEFTNFNPNLYSISVTANVITFDEVADISSLMDIGDFGFSFKGLRYALDPRNDNFDDMQKSIVISLSADSSLKILDIDADVCNIKLENISLSGDLLLNIGSGVIDMSDVTSKSTISITGENLTTTINNTSSKVFRYSASKSNIVMNNVSYTDVDVNIESGRIDCISSVTLDDHIVNLTTETGGILVNSSPITSPFIYEPIVEDGAEQTTNKFKIKTVSAGISLTYPTNISNNNSDEGVNKQ